MKTWARIENGRVAETFDFDTDPTALFVPGWTWVEAPAGTVQGATYDGTSFVNPGAGPSDPTPGPARRSKLTPAEFRNSFSAFEEVAIVDFTTAVDANEPAQMKTLRKVVGVFFDRLKDPHLTTVALDDPRNIDGLRMLVTIGVLTPGRMATITDGLPA